MTIKIIEQRLLSYNCQTYQEEEQALREITQELVLSALSHTDFFKHAAFHGGTCLRIFHNLNRFSEDLDFCLLKANPSFDLIKYANQVASELKYYSCNITIKDRSKSNLTVKKAFLKEDSLGKTLQLAYTNSDGGRKNINIKIEVDSNPPKGANICNQYLEFPQIAAINCHDLSSLFSGKLHALLCRIYLKGRDWYDLTYYSRWKTKANLELLKNALFQNGPYANKEININEQWIAKELKSKISKINWDEARKDVSPFVKKKEIQSVELWSEELFTQLVDKAFGER